MAERIPQSATIRVALRAYLSTDHLSPATGKTIPITISKNGAAFGNPSAGVTNATEIASGWYYVDMSTTDTGTVGPLIILGTLAGIDTIEIGYDVAAYQTFPTNFSSLAIDASGRVDVIKINGTAQTARDIGASVLLSAGTGTGQLDFTSGVVKANLVQILASAITGTAAQLAAGFTKWFNVVTPTSDMNTVTAVTTTTSVTNDVGITQAAADKAWSSTVRTLSAGAITAATFAANALDAVWSTPARTLTAFSFTVNANMVGIIATALTETVGGYLAAGLKKLLDVATPIFTLASTNQTGDSYPIVSSGTYGNSALLTAINNINNLSALANLFGPSTLVRPSSGSIAYPFTYIVRTEEGNPIDADTNTVTLMAKNAAGTDRSANLSAVTHSGTGEYTFTYTVSSAATDEGLAITAAGTVLTVSRKAYANADIADADSLAALAAIQAQTDKMTFTGSNINAATSGGGGAPTVQQIRQEMDANSTQLALLPGIKSQTDKIIGGTVPFLSPVSPNGHDLTFVRNDDYSFSLTLPDGYNDLTLNQVVTLATYDRVGGLLTVAGVAGAIRRMDFVVPHAKTNLIKQGDPKYSILEVEPISGFRHTPYFGTITMVEAPSEAVTP